MASVDTHRRDLSDDVMRRLAAQPERYNLFQAIRLIERARADCVPLGHGDGRDEAVRLGAVTSMKFESRDIASVEPTGESRAPTVLRTAVMALAGVQGPLPEPFARRLFERAAQRDYATRDFLDIFHHRLLTFLYRSKKRRFAALSTLGDADGPPLMAVLRALMGDAQRSAPTRPTYAGLLSSAPRSLQGLETLLQHRLDIRADAKPFVGGWLTIDPRQQCRIAGRRTAGAVLDGRCALGRRAWDQSAGIALRCAVGGRVSPDALLPGGARHGVLIEALKRYLPSRLMVHVTVCMDDTGAVAPLSLSRARLGWTARLSGGPSCTRTRGVAPRHARFSVQLDQHATVDDAVREHDDA
ncbi:type VI secretion system baseplate subunit TssG [Robbsia sp. KACC 23696]|uniref:type VI secretion system baseplate subunit TssG n=1 Tax=Robbsia sp. KACC 23696 TaxID=3149231 RepID=UPI00325C22D8